MVFHCWWECKLIQPLWKMVWRFLKKLGIKPPWPSNPTLRHIFWGNQNWKNKQLYKTEHCIPLFIEALFTIARTWKQPRCPSTDEWIKKLWCIYTMEYYSAIRRNAFESLLMRWWTQNLLYRMKWVRKENINIVF